MRSKSTVAVVALGAASMAALATIASLGFGDAKTPVVTQTVQKTAPTSALEDTERTLAPRHRSESNDSQTSSEEQRPDVNVLAEVEQSTKTPQELEEEEKVLVANIAFSLRNLTDSEGEDKEWLAQMTAEVAESLRSEQFASIAVEGIACGQSVCAVDLSFSEAESSLEDRLGELTSVGPFRNGGFADLSKGNSVALFVAREGQELPDYEQL